MKTSLLTATGLVGAIAIWMAIGMTGDKDTSSEQNNQLRHEVHEVVVEFKTQEAQPVTSYIVTYGDVMPNREVTLRAETAGSIEKVTLDEGAAVKAGNIILQLDMKDRKARLAKAEAKSFEMKQKYTAVRNLGEKGYTAKTKIDMAYSEYKSALADEEQIKVDIKNTSIKAPFAGIISIQQIEIGDYVSVGDELSTIIENNPLIATVPVPQQQINALMIGGMAQVEF
ncbi:MAG: efflux RND transporter periplasmic adaptor subunit, partial [Sulfurimonas sp.]|nr:efflux RND transporter periplasmic adaptor subunit [Sulfurimonas sp.]